MRYWEKGVIFLCQVLVSAFCPLILFLKTVSTRKPRADKIVVVLLVWRPASSFLIFWDYLLCCRCCPDFWSLIVTWCLSWVWFRKHFVLSAIFLKSHAASVKFWISSIPGGSQRSCRNDNFGSLSLSNHGMLSFCLDVTTAYWFWATLYFSLPDIQNVEQILRYSRPLIFPLLTPRPSLEVCPRLGQ